jgi:hypothetical protein
MPCQTHVLPVQIDKSSSQSTAQQPSSCEFVIRFSHHTEPGKFVNMMRAAQLSGLAYYSSTTHLCMHPVYGPWFALRAVAVFNMDGPDPAGFTQLPCPYPDVEDEAADKVGTPVCTCSSRLSAGNRDSSSSSNLAWGLVLSLQLCLDCALHDSQAARSNPWCAVLPCAVPYCALLCCAAVRCRVLPCAVPCCAVLPCAVLCRAVLADEAVGVLGRLQQLAAALAGLGRAEGSRCQTH